MIDDTREQRRPVLAISFVDLRALGFTISVTEFEKQKPSGDVVTAVRIDRVMRNDRIFPKPMMQEFLHVLGIDSLSEGSRYWCCPKKKHRCLSQQEPVVDYRIMGFERTDRAFLESGRASTEAHLWASNMKDMSEVAENLKQGGGES